ncbi:conjugal transfer protein TraD [Raoultella ornithinolytica]|uniref:conjugal transfer protein TraD n=1 Tax=Raoultella ornithinolytica TaxID=54291 RepID=UPI00301C30DE
MSEDKKLKQLLASAQQELNRLTTAQKYQSRKEKTHRKIVLGGEVAKYMGLDIDQEVLVGYLMKFANCSDDEVALMKINGARAMSMASMRKEQGKQSGVSSSHHLKEKDNEKKDNSSGLEYGGFISRLEKALKDKKP